MVKDVVAFFECVAGVGGLDIDDELAYRSGIAGAVDMVNHEKLQDAAAARLDRSTEAGDDSVDLVQVRTA